MTQKKLVKKLILTANLKGLSELKFKRKARVMAQSQIDEPTFVPGLNPPGTVVIGKIDDLEALYDTRGLLQAQMKANTGKIKDSEDEIRDIITDLWMPQTQKAIGRDEGKAKRLGYGIKGVDDGHSDQHTWTTDNSFPIIISIDKNVQMQHTLYIHNNRSGEIVLPDDASRIDVYEWIGDDEPPYDLLKLSFLGVAKGGKFINHFEADQFEKHVWYVVVYVSKKTGKPCGHLDAQKATII